MLPDAREPRTSYGQIPTPLPKMQLATLLLVQLAEPVAATVIHPFIAELVNNVGVTNGDPRKIGYYAGLIESLFFFTEFLFTLQWGRLSDRVGRKPVLLGGVFGLMISITCFGLSTTFTGLVISRAIAGLTCGNMGVAKSMMGEITDETNMALGFSFLPIAWATGIVIGPTLGGYLAHPAEIYPQLFRAKFWSTYPYFLPCATAAGVCFISWFIALCFLKETVQNPWWLWKRHTQNEYQPLSTDPEEDNYELSPTPSTATFSVNFNLEKAIPSQTPPPAPSIISLLSNQRIRRSIILYTLLALVDMSINSLQPIMLAAPIQSGGLSFSRRTIGTALAFYGLNNGVLQILTFSRIHSRWGTKRVMLWMSAMTLPAIFAFPLMNYFARREMTLGVILSLVMQFTAFVGINMAFSCSFLLITSSAPSRSTLGTINGVSQTFASFMRSIGPAGTTSLFAISNERNLLSGNLVYSVMCFFALIVVLLVAVWVPEGAWEREGEKEKEAGGIHL